MHAGHVDGIYCTLYYTDITEYFKPIARFKSPLGGGCLGPLSGHKHDKMTGFNRVLGNASPANTTPRVPSETRDPIGQ